MEANMSGRSKVHKGRRKIGSTKRRARSKANKAKKG
jgi:hypothetical protein